MDRVSKIVDILILSAVIILYRVINIEVCYEIPGIR